jgi:hypothetical protein
MGIAMSEEKVMVEKPVTFYSGSSRLAGVLRYPSVIKDPAPAVLLIHGSLEQDRDGNLLNRPDGRPIFKKNFFLEISKRLSAEGFATFSWDRRGFGESESSIRDGGYLQDGIDAMAAYQALSSLDLVDPERVAVLGQSAGVYTACLLAEKDSRPKAYILQGGLYRDYEEMMIFNYLRVVDYASKSPENLRWVEENDPLGLVIGLNLYTLMERARMGEVEHQFSYKGRTWRIWHDPICYLPEHAPRNLFKYIQKPTLVIHGACDLNVPVEDAFMIERDLKKHGNENVELAIIPDADHSFQQIAESYDLTLRERMSLESFRRPYREDYFMAVISFLKRWL